MSTKAYIIDEAKDLGSLAQTWEPQRERVAMELIHSHGGIIHRGVWVDEARRVALELKASHLAVVDDHGRPEGVLCMCDLQGRPPNAEVSECMTLPPITIEFDAPASTSVQLMRTQHVGCLPVLYDGHVIGVLTRGDLHEENLLSDSECPRCALCSGYHRVRPDAKTGTPRCSRCAGTDPWELQEDDYWCTD